jgi:hypothetical protein
MIPWYRHPRLWLGLILAIVIVAAIVLWARGSQTDRAHSPLPTPVAWGSSPLTTPIPEDAVSPPPSSWTNSGAILLWVALGLLLALGLAVVILRWYRTAA